MDGLTLSSIRNLGWHHVYRPFAGGGGRHPVLLENDANAAALGERVFGADEVSDLIFVTVSTSGGGIIVNNRLVEGRNGGAVDRPQSGGGRTVCGCGNAAVWALASGTAMAGRWWNG